MDLHKATCRVKGCTSNGVQTVILYKNYRRHIQDVHPEEDSKD